MSTWPFRMSPFTYTWLRLKQAGGSLIFFLDRFPPEPLLPDRWLEELKAFARDFPELFVDHEDVARALQTGDARLARELCFVASVSGAAREAAARGIRLTT